MTEDGIQCEPALAAAADIPQLLAAALSPLQLYSAYIPVVWQQWHRSPSLGIPNILAGGASLPELGYMLC